jgi:hypothetical protein
MEGSGKTSHLDLTISSPREGPVGNSSWRSSQSIRSRLAIELVAIDVSTPIAAFALVAVSPICLINMWTDLWVPQWDI